MSRRFRFSMTSDVAADPETVWARVSTMAGVNAELGPWVQMSVPPGADDITLAPTGRVAFHSWLSLGGVLPFDRHALTLVEVRDREGFIERSSSWLQACWGHTRTLTPLDGGTRVTDHLEVQPRVAITAPLTARIVRALFAHRHRQLRAHFGTMPSHTPS